MNNFVISLILRIAEPKIISTSSKYIILYIEFTSVNNKFDIVNSILFL